MTMTAQATLIGRLAKDPEFKSYNNGATKILKITIITNKAIKRGTEWVEQSNTFYADIFGPLAEVLYNNKTLQKGDLVKLDCEIYNTSYEKDGKTIYSNNFKVYDFTRLARPQANRPQNQPSGLQDVPMEYYAQQAEPTGVYTGVVEDDAPF